MRENELRALLEDMSLKEKIGQLTQLDASCFNDEGPVTGPASNLGITEEDVFLCGSVLGLTGAAETEALQKMCMAKQPHGIPLLLMADTRAAASILNRQAESLKSWQKNPQRQDCM